MQLTLLAEQTIGNYHAQNANSRRDLRKEPLRRLAYGSYIREAELQEDRSIRFDLTPRGKVDLCIVTQELLSMHKDQPLSMTRHCGRGGPRQYGAATCWTEREGNFTVSFPTPALQPAAILCI
jgi:hypothetical protein